MKQGRAKARESLISKRLSLLACSLASLDKAEEKRKDIKIELTIYLLFISLPLHLKMMASITRQLSARN